MASLIMLTHNQLAYTRMCVESLCESTTTSFELIVVDNGSTDGTMEYLASLVEAHERVNHQQVRVIANRTNLGFPAANNQGLAVAQGDYIILINNDLLFTNFWLQRMIAHAQTVGVGLVGPRSNYCSGPQRLREVDYNNPQDRHRLAADLAEANAGQSFGVRRLIAFCLLILPCVIEKIGGLDERFGIGNGEDDDFCLRAVAAGFRCQVARDVFVHHFGSQTFKAEGLDYKRQCVQIGWNEFRKKWAITPDAALKASLLQPPRFDPEAHYCPLPSLTDVPVWSRGAE